MFRTWLATTMIAATAATGVVVAAPPSAADPSFDPCEFAKNLPMKLLPPRALTFHLMVASPYGAVRSAAESAYNSPHGEVAIKAFMPRGWCEATRRAEQEAITHDVIIQRILETHSYETSPRVWSAAEDARTGEPADKDYFVRHGLAQARAADQRTREEDAAHANAVKEFDRAYIDQLRDPAQGEQVSKAADWARRQGHDDADIAEFYTYAWARSAQLDLRQFQLTTAEQEMRWLAAIDGLKYAALEAEAAAKGASGEAKRALQAEAADKWGQVAAGATPSLSGWVQAQQTADSQAGHWRAVHLLASAKDAGPNWKAMIKPARANRDAWIRDGNNADGRVTFWQDVLDEAIAAEEVLRPSES